jgi:hypothetical protein
MKVLMVYYLLMFKGKELHIFFMLYFHLIYNSRVHETESKGMEKNETNLGRY